MVFYETDVFTARIVEFIDDESYAALQAVLVADPEAGDLVPKTRGLRKIRWMGSGRGKRGGYVSSTIWFIWMRYSCFTPTLRIENPISVPATFWCSGIWSNNTWNNER